MIDCTTCEPDGMGGPWAHVGERLAPCPDWRGASCGLWQGIVERELRACGIGERFLHPQMERVASDIRVAFGAWLSDIAAQVQDGTGFLLLGAPGSGKTAALALVARVAITAGIRWQYIRLSGFLTDVHNGREDSARHRVRRCQEVPLLLLDEFGGSYESTFGGPALDELMDMRYAEKRCTCIATNAAVAELEGHVDWQRMLSRWHEMCPDWWSTGAVDQRRAVA